MIWLLLPRFGENFGVQAFHKRKRERESKRKNREVGELFFDAFDERYHLRHLS